MILSPWAQWKYKSKQEQGNRGEGCAVVSNNIFSGCMPSFLTVCGQKVMGYSGPGRSIHFARETYQCRYIYILESLNWTAVNRIKGFILMLMIDALYPPGGESLLLSKYWEYPPLLKRK